jgi:hypothetical protein
MKILLQNREFTFDNLERKKEKIILKNFNLITSLDYNFFIDMLKLSIDNYVNYNNNDDINNLVEEYFSYFKITTNILVKKNISCKIIHIYINNLTLLKNSNTIKKIKDYLSIKNDNYYIFLKFMLNLRSINKNYSHSKNINEECYFTFFDFLMDYYE